MRRITRLAWTVSLGAMLLAFGARAQSNPGFTAATPVAPFTATTGGVTATMPAGPAIVVTNTGATNAVYCQQGLTASTSSQYIASGSWFEFARINGQTQMTCITATSTTTINMVGGVGQAAGSGGGGGGGGGPTANVSIVSPLGSSLSAASVAVVIASDQAAVAVKQATAANLNATVVGAGTAGTANAGVETVQGIAGMTPLLVTPSALPANQSVNVAQVNGVTTLTGAGATGTGAQRVTAAQDTTTIAGSAPGTAGSASANVVTVQGIASMTKLLVTPDSVALPANQSVNVAQVNGVTTLTGTGAVGTGAQRIAVGTDTATIAGSAPGTVAAGAAPTNTVEAGCQYNATNPAATDTQALSMQCDTAGRLKVNAQPATQNAVSGTANTTGNSTTSLVSAVTSNRIYVSAFGCANTGSSASLISFQDGSGGTTLWTTIVPAGGGSNIDGNTALFKTTSGNGVYFLPATASTTIYCSAAGYSGP